MSKSDKRVAKAIKDLTVEMNTLRDLMDSESDPLKANAMSHDVSQMWVIIQSLMTL